MTITLTPTELAEVTGYEQATKQLNVLHSRGFSRAFINRLGTVTLERPHFEAVCAGATQPQTKAANVAFLRKAA